MAVAKKKPIKTSASSGHITNLKQSILDTFDIYDWYRWKINLHVFVMKMDILYDVKL
jgi:hypothetical protein